VDEGQRSKRNIPGHNVGVFAQSAGLPCEADLLRAADVLNAGKRVAILVGQGALGAAAELEIVADTLGAPIIKALLGKGVSPTTAPSPPAASASSARRRRRTRSPTATPC
jgi:thiamine pyrophosphate-dependent acetolactate synthase large subunit-like protein